MRTIEGILIGIVAGAIGIPVVYLSITEFLIPTWREMYEDTFGKNK